MRRADKQRAQQYPEPDGNIAENEGNRRADDGPAAGNGGEMVAENDDLFRGHIIDAVIDFNRRRHMRAIDIENFFNIAAIKAVA